MVRLRSPPKFYVALLAMMLIITLTQVPVRAQSSLDPVVVLYDNSHRPQFDPYDTDEGLGLMLNMVNASSRYIVKVHEGSPLNDTILADVDILIIASPDESDIYTRSELSAIKEMMNNGSSLLLFGDPMIDQSLAGYWADTEFRDIGENMACNRFLNGMNITGVRFSINHTVSGATERDYGDTMLDYNQSLNATSPYIISMDAQTWDASHPIFKDINELVVMTATLKPIDVVSSIAWSYDTTFAQYRRGPNSFGPLSVPNITLEEFEENPYSYSAINTTQPSWLAAFEMNESRIIVGGSTIMFSGRTLELDESDDRHTQQFFYLADNRFLFMNMLDWLSYGSVEAPSAIAPLLILSTAIFAVGAVYFIIQKRRT